MKMIKLIMLACTALLLAIVLPIGAMAQTSKSTGRLRPMGRST